MHKLSFHYLAPRTILPLFSTTYYKAIKINILPRMRLLIKLSLLNPLPPYISVHGTEIRLDIRVQTRSKKPGIHGTIAERIKIGLASPPVDGKANDELIKLLSKELDCPKSSIKILKGETNREKCLSISGVSVKRILEILTNQLS